MENPVTHGHVAIRPDGTRETCGGPALCSICASELLAYLIGDLRLTRNHYLDASTDLLPEQLQPKTRLYRYTPGCLFVARIGMAEDWSAYMGPTLWRLDGVADDGYKLQEEEAVLVFPICVEAGLSYRP